MFVEVLLDLPVDQTFTYKLSGYESNPPAFGKRVIVPFGRGELLKTGIILSVKESLKTPILNLKEVFDIPDSFPLITEEILETCRWISSFYCSSLGEALFRFIPESFLVQESILVSFKDKPPETKLTPSEEAVLNELLKSSSKRLKLSTLRRRLKIKSLSSVISNLVKKGVVERLTEIEGEKVPKEVYLKVGAPCQYRGKRGRELIEILSERREVPVKEVKALGFSDSVIKNLVEKGCAELVYKKVSLEGREIPLKDLRKVKLTPSQKRAYDEILSSDLPFLLSGVTGSGKMEVYLNVAREFVKRGKGVIILVPELLLTPELKARVEAYLGENVDLYCGKLTPKEKASVWLKALRGETKVFLGTRPAVLLPVKNLGLIIVDEEQDPSYKENQKPYYNAREVAIKRAQIEKAKLLLVSATPSVESFYRFRKGEIGRFHLKERVGKIPLPVIEVVDLRKEERRGIFSKKLLETLERVVKGGRQVLLYIPRRGFYSTVFCDSCGWSAECKYCKVNLTYHKSSHLLICHMCGRRYRPVSRCPKCSAKLTYRGYGTERVEEELLNLFPNWKVVRLDLDTVKDPISGAKLISEIKEGKYQVIVGTNIAIKGHNFPNLSFVGILLAELLSGAPDYRASERIFQSILQATGRAGRFQPGSAIVQTFNPEFPPIKYAVNYLYDGFYSEELFGRELLGYPPYTLGVLLEFQLEKKGLERELKDRYDSLSTVLSGKFNFPKLSPAPIPKISGRYRYQAFITTSWENHLEKLRELKGKIEKLFPYHKFKCKIDVEPTRIL
ncbi:replication restart DNA helicase PriA [Thermovibrio guaymasensis]|uniref:Replication restart protein PriA n=1 Tax=Thermovibrio guaymasensis TaxID=240167 RepID=A0A420W650_9BACT|nr:primosomal protein N' [Thermovibrio guaymasensis]RKQ60649.1 replication restart DNA helicase PriA [Thermovibrio guaymasensis]